MKIYQFGKQAFFRIFANLVQATTFIFVARYTERNEIGILAFLLTVNAFQVAFFDFGLSKKILLAKSRHFLEEMLKSVLRTSIPFIGILFVLLGIMNTFIINFPNIFFIWGLTIATERFLDYFQIFLLSRLKSRHAFMLMLVRRIIPLVILAFFQYEFSLDDYILECYIIATLISNTLISVIFLFVTRDSQSIQNLDKEDPRILSHSKFFSLLSILEQYRNLDVILMMFFFGSSITGEYSLIARLFNPALLIIGSVLTQIVQENHQIESTKFKSPRSIWLLLLAVPLFLFLIHYFQEIVSKIYGFATQDMKFFFVLFIFATISHFLSGFREAQMALEFDNHHLVYVQVWIFGCTLLLTIILFAFGELRLGLIVYSSAYFLKFVILSFRHKKFGHRE